MLVWMCGCGDDGGPAGSESGTGSTTTADTDPVGTQTGTGTGTGSSSESSDGTSGSTSGTASESGTACEPVFEPLGADALPRCEAAVLDCWVACPGPDPHACTSACTAADPTPPYTLDDGTEVDCGRCINLMFGVCWHEACPEEVAASRCCALSSGCDPECIAYGPCDDEDLACLRQACPQELAAQSACLMETGALETCRLQSGGLATACVVGQ